MSDSSIDPFWGAASLREAALAHEVKGNLVAARHRWVTTHFGPDVLQDLAGRLTGQAHTWLLEPPLTIRWCPMAILAEIDEVIVAGPMKGDVAQMRPFGSEIADYDLSTLYRVLFVSARRDSSCVT